MAYDPSDPLAREEPLPKGGAQSGPTPNAGPIKPPSLVNTNKPPEYNAASKFGSTYDSFGLPDSKSVVDHYSFGTQNSKYNFNGSSPKVTESLTDMAQKPANFRGNVKTGALDEMGFEKTYKGSKGSGFTFTPDKTTAEPTKPGGGFTFEGDADAGRTGKASPGMSNLSGDTYKRAFTGPDDTITRKMSGSGYKAPVSEPTLSGYVKDAASKAGGLWDAVKSAPSQVDKYIGGAVKGLTAEYPGAFKAAQNLAGSGLNAGLLQGGINQTVEYGLSQPGHSRAYEMLNTLRGGSPEQVVVNDPKVQAATLAAKDAEEKRAAVAGFPGSTQLNSQQAVTPRFESGASTAPSLVPPKTTPDQEVSSSAVRPVLDTMTKEQFQQNLGPQHQREVMTALANMSPDNPASKQIIDAITGNLIKQGFSPAEASAVAKLDVQSGNVPIAEGGLTVNPKYAAGLGASRYNFGPNDQPQFNTAGQLAENVKPDDYYLGQGAHQRGPTYTDQGAHGVVPGQIVKYDAEGGLVPSRVQRQGWSPDEIAQRKEQEAYAKSPEGLRAADIKDWTEKAKHAEFMERGSESAYYRGLIADENKSMAAERSAKDVANIQAGSEREKAAALGERENAKMQFEVQKHYDTLDQQHKTYLKSMLDEYTKKYDDPQNPQVGQKALRAAYNIMESGIDPSKLSPDEFYKMADQSQEQLNAIEKDPGWFGGQKLAYSGYNPKLVGKTPEEMRDAEVARVSQFKGGLL